MIRKLFPLMAMFLLGLLGCDGDGMPRHEEFRAGMNRSSIVEAFGPPDHVRTFRKSGDAIWGPIEDFWPKVPSGSAMEVWAYRTTHRVGTESSDRFPGRTELYFIDGSETVQGIGFALEGAVYEGRRQDGHASQPGCG